MKIKVHLLAFVDDVIREVEIPEAELKDRTIFLNKPTGLDDPLTKAVWEVAEEGSIPINYFLEIVWKYGQNDFQAQGLPSMSVGDVVEIDSRYWMAVSAGFKELSPVQYDLYKETPQRDRAFKAMFELSK